MTLRLLVLLLFAPFAGAQTVVLAGGGGEGDVGDTAAWSYGLYGALVENGDTDGDGVHDFFDVQRFIDLYNTGCP